MRFARLLLMKPSPKQVSKSTSEKVSTLQRIRLKTLDFTPKSEISPLEVFPAFSR
jgi:hypothetical protein